MKVNSGARPSRSSRNEPTFHGWAVRVEDGVEGEAATEVVGAVVDTGADTGVVVAADTILTGERDGCTASTWHGCSYQPRSLHIRRAAFFPAASAPDTTLLVGQTTPSHYTLVERKEEEGNRRSGLVGWVHELETEQGVRLRSYLPLSLSSDHRTGDREGIWDPP